MVLSLMSIPCTELLRILALVTELFGTVSVAACATDRVPDTTTAVTTTAPTTVAAFLPTFLMVVNFMWKASWARTLCLPSLSRVKWYHWWAPPAVSSDYSNRLALRRSKGAWGMILRWPTSAPTATGPSPS